MQCFRLSHAGVVLELDGASLFVDPGNFSSGAELSTAIEAAAPIAGIVITHEHADHYHLDSLRTLLAKNPEVQIFANTSVAELLTQENISQITIQD